MATSLIERVETGLSTPCKRWEQGLAPEPEKPCWGPEKYKGKVDFDKYVSWGVSLLVPIIHLFGTQPMEQYELGKRRTVETKLQRCGIDCLKEHPVPLCGVSNGKTLTLAIPDGHHRTRYGAPVANRMLPSVVYTPEQLVDIYNQNNVYEKPITIEWLVDDFNQAIAETMRSFSRSLPENKNPLLVPVSSIADLRMMYPAF